MSNNRLFHGCGNGILTGLFMTIEALSRSLSGFFFFSPFQAITKLVENEIDLFFFFLASFVLLQSF